VAADAHEAAPLAETAVIEALWGSRPLAAAGEWRARRLNKIEYHRALRRTLDARRAAPHSSCSTGKQLDSLVRDVAPTAVTHGESDGQAVQSGSAWERRDVLPAWGRATGSGLAAAVARLSIS
jgi:hypothetical protein